jgi:hypothetical protein
MMTTRSVITICSGVVTRSIDHWSFRDLTRDRKKPLTCFYTFPQFPRDIPPDYMIHSYPLTRKPS